MSNSIVKCGKCKRVLESHTRSERDTMCDCSGSFWGGGGCSCTFTFSMIVYYCCLICKCETTACGMCSTQYPRQDLYWNNDIHKYQCPNCYDYSKEKKQLIRDLKRSLAYKQNPTTKDKEYKFAERDLIWYLVKEFGNCVTCKRRCVIYQGDIINIEESMYKRNCATCRGIIYNPYELNQFMKSYYLSVKSKQYCNYISQTGGRYYYPSNMNGY